MIPRNLRLRRPRNEDLEKEEFVFMIPRNLRSRRPRNEDLEKEEFVFMIPRNLRSRRPRNEDLVYRNEICFEFNIPLLSYKP
jgi:hypothetical protein